MKFLQILFVSLILLVGCDKQPAKNWQPANVTDAKVLSKAMSEVSNSDLRIIHVQYSGIVEYMKNAKVSFMDTLSVEEAIGKFQSDYSYTPSQYPELTNAFTSYMKSRGMLSGEESREIVDSVSDTTKQVSRKKLIEDLQTVADAARLTLESR